MQIYITKGVEQIGPFSEEEIREQLERGEAKGTDLAWCDGRSDWGPLSEILSIIPEPCKTSEPADSPEISDPADTAINTPEQIEEGTVSSGKIGPPPIANHSSELSATPSIETGSSKIVSPPPIPKNATGLPATPATESPSVYTKEQKNKKLISGILAILIGWLGVHKFYLGYKVEGAIMLIVSIVGSFLCFPTFVVWIVAIIEGIIYLSKSDDAFVTTYVVGRKGWF